MIEEQKISKALEYVEYVSTQCRRAESLNMRREAVAAKLDGFKSRNGGGGKSTSNQDAVAQVTELMEEVCDRLQGTLNQLQEDYRVFEMTLERLEPTHEHILYRHYIEGAEWEEVKSDAVVSCGIRRMYELRALALCELYDYMPRLWKE